MLVKYFGLFLIVVVNLTACSDDEYETYHYGVKEPYVLVDGCKFWIYSDSGSAAVGAPKVKGGSEVTVTYSVTSGSYMLKARDCKIVENASNLPVYKK